MANPYKGDAAGARAFLQLMGVDTSKMKSEAYPIRIAGKIEKQLARGQAVNVQAGRGHAVTPEHPGRAAPQHREYQSAPRRAERAGRAHEPQYLPSGGAHFFGHTKREANFAVSVAQQTGGTIQISYVGRDGEAHTLFRHGGISPDALRDALNTHGSWHATVAALAEDIYGDDDDGAVPELGDEVQFFIE